jgi:uncharacterized membrane protein YidH (DUF202 family)
MNEAAVASELSLIRTKLSNTRTLLSHTKAAIGLIISSLAFIKLFDSYLIFDICGWTFMGLAILVMIRGFFVYRKTKSAIDLFASEIETGQ